MLNSELSCMLAKDYYNVTPQFPYMAQEKLNGIRAVWLPQYKRFFSRTGKSFNAIPELDRRMKNVNLPLDGELYSKELSCQEINARLSVNRIAPHEDHGRIQFHAFDVYGSPDYYETRYKYLINTYNLYPTSFPIYNEAELDEHFKSYMSMGAEGIMLRSTDSPYIHGRTHHLLKVKKTLETTAHIIEVIKGESIFKNIMGALVVVEKSTGIIFRVGGGFTIEQRKDIWEHPQQYLDLEIKVVFAERSLSKTPKQPRFAGFVQ